MSKRDPVVKIQIHVPADVPARASLAALAASNEAGRIVPAYEMHRRAYLAGLPLIEACAECRAGTCDGSKHVRQDNFVGLKVCQNEPVAEATIQKTTEQNTVPKSVEATPAEQVGMFFTEPVEDKPAPEPKKKPRKRSYPEGFALTDEMRNYAVKNGIAPDRVDGVFEHFSNHHRAKGSVYVDWTLAFYTWVRNDKQYGGKNQAPVAVRRSGTTQDEMPEGWA